MCICVNTYNILKSNKKLIEFKWITDILRVLRAIIDDLKIGKAAFLESGTADASANGETIVSQLTLSTLKTFDRLSLSRSLERPQRHLLKTSNRLPDRALKSCLAELLTVAANSQQFFIFFVYN